MFTLIQIIIECLFDQQIYRYDSVLCSRTTLSTERFYGRLSLFTWLYAFTGNKDEVIPTQANCVSQFVHHNA